MTKKSQTGNLDSFVVICGKLGSQVPRPIGECCSLFQKKKQQKKKSQLKFTIDCTHPVEDGILKANDLVG